MDAPLVRSCNSFPNPRSQTPFGNALPETPFRVHRKNAVVTPTRFGIHDSEYPNFMTCTLVGHAAEVVTDWR